MTDKRLLIVDDEPEMAEVVRLLGMSKPFQLDMLREALIGPAQDE